METLQSYGNSEEDADFEAFVAGRPKPDNPGHEQWQVMVRANVQAGRIMQRVHVVVEPLSQYLQLELTWGYGPNAAAGEDIRIIPVRAGEEWPRDVPEGMDAAIHHAMAWQNYIADKPELAQHLPTSEIAS